MVKHNEIYCLYLQLKGKVSRMERKSGSHKHQVNIPAPIPHAPPPVVNTPAIKAEPGTSQV